MPFTAGCFPSCSSVIGWKCKKCKSSRNWPCLGTLIAEIIINGRLNRLHKKGFEFVGHMNIFFFFKAYSCTLLIHMSISKDTCKILWGCSIHWGGGKRRNTIFVLWTAAMVWPQNKYLCLPLTALSEKGIFFFFLENKFIPNFPGWAACSFCARCSSCCGNESHGSCCTLWIQIWHDEIHAPAFQTVHALVSPSGLARHMCGQESEVI